MAHRLPADSYSGSGAETVQRAEIGLFSREKHVVILGLGTAEVRKFVEFVIHAGFFQNCCQDEAARRRSDDQTVRLSGSVDMICDLPASTARAYIPSRYSAVREYVFFE